MIKSQSPAYLLPEFGKIPYKGSIQNITVSNLLNRLESLNFCTQAEAKEYYEALRDCHLPQKLKF